MLDSLRLRLTLLPLALLIGSLTACSSMSGPKQLLESLTPYRFDRVQGNVVTREQYTALRAGMSRNTVRDILGTPLLTSLFHADRWDYVFTLSRQGAEPQARRVTLFFNGDVLARFEADELPSEAEFVATLKSKPAAENLPPLDASEESLLKFPVAPKPSPVPPPVAKPPGDYPPLEPPGR